MNYSQISRYVLLSILLLHSTSVHSYDWSCFSWTSICATITALSYKGKVALLLTAAIITRLLYKNKRQSHLTAENARIDDDQPGAQPQRNGLVRSIAVQTVL